jgi:hypothetical protein
MAAAFAQKAPSHPPLFGTIPGIHSHWNFSQYLITEILIKNPPYRSGCGGFCCSHSTDFDAFLCAFQCKKPSSPAAFPDVRGRAGGVRSIEEKSAF